MINIRTEIFLSKLLCKQWKCGATEIPYNICINIGLINWVISHEFDFKLQMKILLTFSNSLFRKVRVLIKRTQLFWYAEKIKKYETEH